MKSDLKKLVQILNKLQDEHQLSLRGRTSTQVFFTEEIEIEGKVTEENVMACIRYYGQRFTGNDYDKDTDLVIHAIFPYLDFSTVNNLHEMLKCCVKHTQFSAFSAQDIKALLTTNEEILQAQNPLKKSIRKLLGDHYPHVLEEKKYLFADIDREMQQKFSVLDSHVIKVNHYNLFDETEHSPYHPFEEIISFMEKKFNCSLWLKEAGNDLLFIFTGENLDKVLINQFFDFLLTHKEEMVTRLKQDKSEHRDDMVEKTMETLYAYFSMSLNLSTNSMDRPITKV